MYEHLLKLIGSFPPRAPLDTTILASEDCGTYMRNKIEYSVEPNERARAYILIPKDLEQPVPAVYCHHQHDGNWAIGKSEVVGLIGDPNMAYAKELAERGYVAIAPDAISFEERNKNSFPGIDKFNLDANVDEFTKRLLLGQTLFSKVLQDIMTSIDYLQSLRTVDREKIGFIGHGYGGIMAMMAPAFDKRIRTSVANCAAFSFRKSTSVMMEVCIPGIVNICDTHDIISLIDPNNLFISATENDRFCSNAKELYDLAKDNFKSGELKFELYPGGHVFTPEMRENAYQFLDKYLM